MSLPAWRREDGALIVDVRTLDARGRPSYDAEALRNMGVPDNHVVQASKSIPKGYLAFDDDDLRAPKPQEKTS